MIAYLKGILVIKAQGYIVIDVNSVGYKVFMTDTSIENLKIEEEIKIFTYMRVREDDISLYGFLSNEELMMFELLISAGMLISAIWLYWAFPPINKEPNPPFPALLKAIGPPP